MVTTQPITAIQSLPDQAQARLVTGWEFWWASGRIAGRVFRLAWNRFRNPFRAIKEAWGVIHSRDDFKTTHRRMVKANGRYYMNLHTPGWPSPAFDRGIAHAFNIYSGSTQTSLFSFIFSITNKCGFQCAHCVEWNQLNTGDHLSGEALIQVICRFQELGVCQVHLSGGEPLNRYHDILHILAHFPAGIDFWIFTNGYALDRNKAAALKQHGLTGVVISLDHHEPQGHDAFRGVPGSYQRALQAAQEARANGLLVAFSCCATNEFVSAANLEHYATVCKQAGASFIQVLEPEAVGHYAGKAVQLTAGHQKTLEAFFYRLNFDPRFAAFPVVSYPALVKREAGCQGKGLHYLYVDAEGFVQSCPFCRKKLFHATDIHLGQRIRALRSSGCQVMDWKVPPIGPDRAKEPPGQLKQWLSAVPEA